MAKTKTFIKQKAFSLKGMPINEIKGGKGKLHDPDKQLRNTQLIVAALVECLWSGDTKAFKEIIKAHYEAMNKADALRKIGLSKRTFYEAVSPSGNPSLETLSKIIQGLKKAA